MYFNGKRIWLGKDKRPYTVRACNGAFAICTKPYNPKRTVFYTVIDIQKGIRGTENSVFETGTETVMQCEEMLERLTVGVSEISHRNNIPLKIAKMDADPRPHGWLSADIDRHIRVSQNLLDAYKRRSSRGKCEYCTLAQGDCNQCIWMHFDGVACEQYAEDKFNYVNVEVMRKYECDRDLCERWRSASMKRLRRWIKRLKKLRGLYE